MRNCRASECWVSEFTCVIEFLEMVLCLFWLTGLCVYPRGIFRKSTFFNVLTKSAAAAENFPFCTIGQCTIFTISHIYVFISLSTLYLPDVTR